MKTLLVWLALVIAFVTSVRPARAHDFEWGVLALVETAPGVFDVGFTEPVDSVGIPDGVSIRWPEGCVIEGHRLRCTGSIDGVVHFDGLGISPTKIVVTVRWLDGRSFDALASGEEPDVALSGSRAPTSTWRWLVVGLEHVLAGADHVAFIVGLFLVAFRPDDPRASLRRLALTVTAFTVAHSVTLVLAVMQIVHVPRAPVEACIALSILLVASEALSPRPTLTVRRPWAVALLFGLVHGLGFAGALTEIGLPRRSLGSALVLFNVGVELGQLIVVAAMSALALAWSGFWRRSRWWSYALGGISAYWLIERTISIFVG